MESPNDHDDNSDGERRYAVAPADTEKEDTDDRGPQDDADTVSDTEQAAEVFSYHVIDGRVDSVRTG